MKEFLAILFMGNSILLTQDPINISSHWVELNFDGSISAINSGASVQIDVSEAILWSDTNNIDDVRVQLQKVFPKKSIQAKLIDAEGTEVILMYEGNSMINKEKTLLSLHAENGVPTGIDFKKIMIYSEVDINGVYIYWKNYKK